MNINSIGIVGTGSFGSFLIEILPQIFPNTRIRSFSRKSFPFYEHIGECDMVIPAVPIRSFEEVIKKISPLLRPGSIVMDVCSVKIIPVKILKKYLPSTVQIIATHPMFGPGTFAKTGTLAGLRLVMDNITAADDMFQFVHKRLAKAGLNVIEMSAEEHDSYAAKFHFTAHLMASIIKQIHLSRSPIDTKSVESLFDFVEMVQADSSILLKEMYRYNPYCKTQLNQIISAQNTIISQLQIS